MMIQDSPDTVDAPANPMAQNQATQAMKPKPPLGGVAQGMPQVAPVEAQTTGVPMTNTDPNAYAPPPQGAPATAPASAAQPGPITPPPALGPVDAGYTPSTSNPNELPALGASASPGGFSWKDPVTGQEQNGTTAPVGVGYRESAPLIPTTSGGAMTPQGDAANSFRGYVSSDGGKFGADAATSNAEAIQNLAGATGVDASKFGDLSGKTPQQIDQYQRIMGLMANGVQSAWEEGLTSDNPFVKQTALTEITKHLTGQTWAKLSPEQQAQVRQISTTGLGGYAADQMGQHQQDAMLKFSPAERQIIFDRQLSNFTDGPAPADRLAGNYTAKDPAEQARLLAAQGGSTGTPPTATQTLGANAPGSGGMPQPPDMGLPGVSPVNGGPKVNNAPVLPGAGPVGQPTPASGMGNVAQSATTPQNALTNSTLSRAPGADRFKIAQDQYDTSVAAGEPQYQANLRDAMRKAAAGGALGSGMLNTSLGDIVSNRDLANKTNRSNLLSEALKGTISDQFGDVGIAQQQQGFQQGQQQQAFGNEVTKQNLQESLTNGSFQRALQQLTAGSTNNPADTALVLSQIFGNQASGAGSSLAQLLAGLGNKNAQGTQGTTGTAAAPNLGNIDWGSLLSQILAGTQNKGATG